jgi:hypothetical protein
MQAKATKRSSLLQFVTCLPKATRQTLVVIPMKVSYINFWNGFVPEGHFIKYLIDSAIADKSTVSLNPEKADLVISSCFGEAPSPREKTIFFTGENVRPNFLKHRFSISYDIDPWGGRNFYLPYWYAHLKWPGYEKHLEPMGVATHQNEELIDPKSLTQKRVFTANNQRRKFCAFVAGNPEPLRLNIYAILSSYKKIDGFGKLFGKPTFHSKHKFLKEYRFSLCAENGYFPGYVTEKLFQAWFADTVPIYFGASDYDPLINKAAFLNYQDFLNIQDFLEHVKEVDSNVGLYRKYFDEPLLHKEPTLDDILTFLSEAIRQINLG